MGLGPGGVLPQFVGPQGTGVRFDEGLSQEFFNVLGPQFRQATGGRFQLPFNLLDFSLDPNSVRQKVQQFIELANSGGLKTLGEIRANLGAASATPEVLEAYRQQFNLDPTTNNPVAAALYAQRAAAQQKLAGEAQVRSAGRDAEFFNSTLPLLQQNALLKSGPFSPNPSVGSPYGAPVTAPAPAPTNFPPAASQTGFGHGGPPPIAASLASNRAALASRSQRGFRPLVAGTGGATQTGARPFHPRTGGF